MDEKTFSAEAMRRLALLGAKSRLADIAAETERLQTMFPELGKQRRAPARGPSVLFAAPTNGVNGKRSTSRKGIPRGKYKVRTPEFKAKVIAAIKAGGFVPDVARKFDVGTTQVRNWCRDARVKVPAVPMAERVKRHKAGRVKSK